MLKKIVLFLFLVLGSAALWTAEAFYVDVDLSKWFYTLTSLAVLYLIFKILLEGVYTRRIQDNKSRYKFRKTISLIYLLIAAVVLLRIWVEDPQSLFVAYGLVAAGVAIALQDIFKNFVGGFILLINSTYRVGDRVEINGEFGDVIDIGLFYTTLLELREWVDGDQATGRLAMVPNGKVLNSNVNNYTKDHHFLWEEITIPITYESNWQKARDLINEIVSKHTKETTTQAEDGIKRIGEKYYLSKRNTQPNVFISMTDNWVDFHIRFVVDVRNRRLTHNEISQKILEMIQAEDDIYLASETLTIRNQ